MPSTSRDDRQRELTDAVHRVTQAQGHLALLASLTELGALVTAWQATAVRDCQRRGASWSSIGGALGVSRQAAHRRFARPASQADHGSPTAEGAAPSKAPARRRTGRRYDVLAVGGLRVLRIEERREGS